MTRSPEPPARRRPADAPRVLSHPRNRHQGRYDFARLTAQCPELSAFLVTTPAGEASIDFSNPDAVRALNRALLKADYGIAQWHIPDGYLVPPIPGRADYLHGLADLLAETHEGVVPRGPAICVLDIGVGANCIYPLLGHSEYGWRFVGSEVDPTALEAARANVHANALDQAIELRLQPARGKVLAGLLRGDDRFELSLCNPPFHQSSEEAARGSQRKWRNLGRPDAARAATALNFGGQATELWCTGGEASFVRRMIRESVDVQAQVLWFSSLVSKAENVAAVHRQLRREGVQEVREVAMAQGSKQSRWVAWSFLDALQRKAWRGARWAEEGR